MVSANDVDVASDVRLMLGALLAKPPRGRGWTRTKVAKELTQAGVPTDQSTVSLIASGQRTRTSADRISALRQLFQMNDLDVTRHDSDQKCDANPVPTEGLSEQSEPLVTRQLAGLQVRAVELIFRRLEDQEGKIGRGELDLYAHLMRILDLSD